MAGSRKSLSTDPLLSVVETSLGRYVGPGERLVVGLSGGIDSVVLLHIVKSLAWPVSAVHVHHGISSSADRWASFCQEVCVSWNVPLLVKKVSVERNSADGLEAAARRARHGVFSDIDADWVLLAHHGDDQAETLLFNLLRGAGIRGAGAMRERHGRLLRPLLSVARAGIVDYAGVRELEWIDDESNDDIRFSRNYLRQRVMPVLRDRFPATVQRFMAASTRFAEASDLLDELARLDLGEDPADFPIFVRRLRALSSARARNLLRFVLSKRGVGIPSEKRLEELLQQSVDAKPDRHPAVAFGRHVLKRRGEMLFLETRPVDHDVRSAP